MDEPGNAGGLLGYVALLWSMLPEAAVTQLARGGSGVPEERSEAEVAIPAPRGALGRRIEA
jgi:hypothetical protein